MGDNAFHQGNYIDLKQFAGYGALIIVTWITVFENGFLAEYLSKAELADHLSILEQRDFALADHVQVIYGLILLQNEVIGPHVHGLAEVEYLAYGPQLHVLKDRQLLDEATHFRLLLLYRVVDGAVEAVAV